MPDLELPAPILVTQTGGLEKLAKRLDEEPIIAVDSESNSLHAYQERVCLVQISTPRANYLVDPLALPDLGALGRVFADPKIEKVFHAAEYDIFCLKRDFQFEFANLFDTMLAARILGWKMVGLGAILEAEFGVSVDKRHQRADWGKRPLADYLLEYASLDVHYLIALRERQISLLKENGLWRLAQEDFNRLCALVSPDNGNSRLACWRISGVHELSAQQTAVLQELCVYRDEQARALDRPLFKVMGDHTLLSIAQALPANVKELKALPGMTEGQVRRHGGALLSAVQRGLRAKPLRAPRSPRPDARYMNRLERLKKWRKEKALELKVESDIVLPRDLMQNLASQNPRDEAELAAVLEGVPWRREQFGRQILEALGVGKRGKL